jgi:HEAT repeat protein
MPDAKPTLQHLRVFLASPGDVADERALVRRLLKDDLPYRTFLRGLVTFDVVSWDDPAAHIPMLATLTPQGSVNRGMPKPSACDIVVVVLWSRMGTPLPDDFRKLDDTSYLSGTEWEYEDAVKAKPAPEVLVYRRTPAAPLDPDDPKFNDKLDQYQRVKQFFTRFTNPDGSFKGGYTTYDTPTAFRELLAKDLEASIKCRLEARPTPQRGDTALETTAPVWQGSPYPGLRSFTPDEAAIFFGRGREVDALIARLRDPAQRFLAVVGASGTGKSSLIRAGLIPRLRDGAIEGSQHWRVVTCTPGAAGDNPFLALAFELVHQIPVLAHKQPIEIATVLAKAPQRISDYAVAPTGGASLLFVDQLEELFALSTDQYQAPFTALLAHAAGHPHLRVLATLRADFLPQAMAEPALAPRLQAGTVPLGPPGPAALADMIRRPAERAGLVLEDGLADEILKDAGNDPGALPLMAFCLEELYQQTAPDHRLTVDAYNTLDRLRGAISRRAAALLEELRETEGEAIDAALPQLFRALVHVDATGTATRRRASQDELGEIAPISAIIDKLVQGRLLAAEGAKGRSTVTLAHEALLLEWPALRDWLDSHRTQLQRVQTLLTALGDDDKAVRESAAQALGRIGPAAMPTLITNLTDTNAQIRGAAAEALGRFGPTAADAVPALITALSDGDIWGRWNAAQALGQIGRTAADAVPALITALTDADSEVRASAAQALGQIGPTEAEAMPVLITALSDADSEVRASAAQALGRIEPAAADAVPALIIVLGDTDKKVRWFAARALGWIGPAATDAVPALITALNGADGRDRWFAAEALGQIGPATADVVPALITALSDADSEVRASAAEALRQIGPTAADAVPALITTLGDADERVRWFAAQALGRIGPAAAEAVPALITALSDGDIWVRWNAAQALGQIGPAAAEAVPALMAALQDSDHNVIEAAEAALQRIQSAAPAAASA